ncbi:uncharacterized protein LOC129950818 [Eupeodes corollae]|uniref:uncharacterized protein LOC129950818 n=1 Tax=Eupeodes corollae TaxID=290404 RepID=UPI002491101A|nr:uncharacterized protein LOC129950818 [Eupeodes corollae]
MEQNIELAKGFCTKAGAHSKWENISVELNSLGPPERTSEKWQRVWVDLKCKTKKKKTENKIEISATGGGPNRLHHFSDMEEAVVSLLDLNTCVNPPGREFGLETINTSDENDLLTEEHAYKRSTHQIDPDPVEVVDQQQKKPLHIFVWSYDLRL